MVLAEGPRCPLSGVVIRLGGFHLLLPSMSYIGTVVTENCTDASSMCTSINHLNDTIYAKNSVVDMVDGRVLKAFAYICYQRGNWQHCYRSRPL